MYYIVPFSLLWNEECGSCLHTAPRRKKKKFPLCIIFLSVVLLNKIFPSEFFFYEHVIMNESRLDCEIFSHLFLFSLSKRPSPLPPLSIRNPPSKKNPQ